MAKPIQKAAPAAAPAPANVAQAAQQAVAQAQGEKKARTPPAPTGFTTAGSGDKRVPWTPEELTAALQGQPAGVHLLSKEWRGKPHYSIIIWNGTAVQATKGGCFELERAQGFTATHARANSMNMTYEPGGALQAPPAIVRAPKTEEGGEAEAAPAAAPAPAPAAPAKKTIAKK